MSGGVDSSVAACLLKEQGYACVGVFMRVGAEHAAGEACAVPQTGEPARRLKHGCCSAADALDARALAGKLGIPFYALNFEADFNGLISEFVDEYARARTPNPCIRCNIELKFGKLLRYADALDAEFVATGHYARVYPRDDGRPVLARARNVAKDQSYVLFGIRRGDLPRCLLPLGEMADKAEVRRVAASLGLAVHDKPDSQEICFVPGGDYRQLARQRRPGVRRDGEIHDTSGNVVGQHEGVYAYTIGQRRGLALAMGYPIYITELNADTNRVIVGRKEDLLRAGLVAGDVNWLVDPPSETVPADIKIRHQHKPVGGNIRVLPDGDVEARFDQPQIAVTPGQAAVFYDNEGVVLGGGWIHRALREPVASDAPVGRD